MTPNVVVQLSIVTRQGLPLPRVPSLGSIPAGQDEGLMQKANPYRLRMSGAMSGQLVDEREWERTHQYPKRRVNIGI